jgi:hypothetical protein
VLLKNRRTAGLVLRPEEEGRRLLLPLPSCSTVLAANGPLAPVPAVPQRLSNMKQRRQLKTMFGIGRRSTLPQIHEIRLLFWIEFLETPAEKCV